MKSGFSNPYIDLTDTQKDVLVGSMLGDGSLGCNEENRSKNARLTIRRALKDWRYLLWEHELFEDFCSTAGLRLFIQEPNVIQPYDSISFQTLSNPVFTEYIDKWYDDNIKIVPRDLELNSMIMLIWFLDDGCITRSNSGKFNLQLSTDGFRKDDTMFLLDLLEERYDCRFEAHCSNIEKQQYRIHGYGDAANAIIEEMKPFFPYEMMGRKATWNIHWEPKIHTYDHKEMKIKEFLYGKEEFYANELGRFAGFTFTRVRDGKERIEVAIGSVKDYLADYLENDILVELKRDSYHSGLKYGITKLGQQYFASKQVLEEIKVFNNKLENQQ
jgi:hypothetical protein